MKNGRWSGLLLGLVALLVAFGLYLFFGTESPTTSTNTVESTQTQQIGDEVSYQGEEGKTALSILESKYTVETKEFSFGRMVQSINGKAADDKHYWAFYVNGQVSNVGADAYTTKNTDTVTWKYTSL